MLMQGRYPAIIESYSNESRECRVKIPGMTDNGDVYPLSEIEYPIGDKSREGAYATELEILPGDTVWIAFIGGDSRYPIITGYRNPQSGNDIDWRRVHHKNIEYIADELMQLISKNLNIDIEELISIKSNSIEINTKTFTVNSDTLTVNSETEINADKLAINADTEINGSSLTHNKTNVGSTHTHAGVQSGTSTTGLPT